VVGVVTTAMAATVTTTATAATAAQSHLVQAQVALVTFVLLVIVTTHPKIAVAAVTAAVALRVLTLAIVRFWVSAAVAVAAYLFSNHRAVVRTSGWIRAVAFPPLSARPDLTPTRQNGIPLFHHRLQ
jgi:hypothetical protein